MAKKIVFGILILLSIAGVLFALFRVDNKQNAPILCQNIMVKINVPKGASQFMTVEDVIKDIRQRGFNIIGENIDSIRLDSLENVLNKNPLFTNAQVISSKLKKEITIILDQKYPKYMVQLNNKLYYVGDNKGLIPVNTNYMVDVPLVTGDIDSIVACNEAYMLVERLQKEKTLCDLVGQIYYDKHKGFILSPRIADVPIIIGVSNGSWDERLKKIYTFIEKVEPLIGWNNIKYVNLSFDNQIVVSDK